MIPGKQDWKKSKTKVKSAKGQADRKKTDTPIKVSFDIYDATDFFIFMEKHLGQVVRAAHLWGRKSLEACEFEPKLHHPTTSKLSQSNQQ